MSESPTPEIAVEELAAVRTSGGLVDVRELEEYATGHVPGALPIPMGRHATRMGELDKKLPVFVGCASGNRSTAMTDLLGGAVVDAVFVAGSNGACTRSGRPLEGGLA